MKRVETSGISKPSHGSTYVEAARVHYPLAGSASSTERRTTLIKDHHESWGQNLWPDCLD